MIKTLEELAGVKTSIVKAPIRSLEELAGVKKPTLQEEPAPTAEDLIEPNEADLEIYRRMGLKQYTSPSGKIYPLTKPIPMQQKSTGIGLGPMWDESGDTRTMRERLGHEKKKPVDVGIPEIFKGIREMVSPTTPYTREESDRMAEEIPDRLKWALKYYPTLGGRLGGKDFKKQLVEEAENFAGFGPALMLAAGETGTLAIEWGIIYPTLFKAVGIGGAAISKIPRVAKATEAIKKMGGLTKLAEKFPRGYARAANITKAVEKGLGVGGILAGAEVLGKDMEPGEVIKHVGKRAALVGAIAGTFQTASEVDTAIYTSRLRNALVKASNSRFAGKLREVDAMAKSTAKSAAYSSLTSLKKAEMQAIDKIVSAAEAQLLGIKGDTLYQLGQEAVESPQRAAERMIRYGLEPGRPLLKGVEALKTGLGKTKPFIEMPMTKVAEVIETSKEIGQMIKHPIRAAQRAAVKISPTTIPKQPSAGVIPPPVRSTAPITKPEAVKVAPEAKIADLSKRADIAFKQNDLDAMQTIVQESWELPETPEAKALERRIQILDGEMLARTRRRQAQPPTIANIGTVDNINVVGLADRFSERLKTSTEPIDNRQVKQWVADALGVSRADLTPEKGYSHKKVQEAMELAIVKAARGIVEENRGYSEETINALVELYDRQPILTARTGTSIEGQAYSTPAPLAFIASELAHIGPGTVVYEPTAGTGMLTIVADPANVIVNEIDPTRAEILRSQGYASVTENDARKAYLEPISDAVIMNPPFGKHKEVRFDGFKLSHIEHIIAAENLKAMRDEGRAVMIIAAPKKMGKYSTPEWIFGNYIYSHYNVIGDFEVAGDLYRRQGAAWPVRIIAIHGRKKSENYGPKAGIFRAKSWSEVYNMMKEILANEPAETTYTTTGEEPGRAEAIGRGAEERTAEELAEIRGPVGRPIEPAGERPEVEGGAGERITQRGPAGRLPGERSGPSRVPAGEREVQPEPSPVSKPSVFEREPAAEERAAAERKERPAIEELRRKPEVKRAEKRKPVGMVGPTALGKLQVKYKPSSKAPAPNENIPTYLEPHVTAALEKLQQSVGDIDDYVREQLQYKSNTEMWGHLSATQIDSVALALDRIDKGSALIVGHQTGVGKGRVGAALVRREILNGRKPIFFTSGKHLFTDFFRDLFDVGLTEDQIKPLMMNADVDIKDQKNRVVFKKHGSRPAADRAIHKAIRDKDYNLVLSTYHQVNTETRKQRMQIAELIKGQLLILDESHNAAGESQTGEYIREMLIPHSSGVLFSSATYAKTPKTMTLYARTGLLDAFDGDRDNMLEAVQTGGEPYQEVIAAALARANSYIRTELDFSGVKYETTIDARHLERDTERADKVTEVFRQIISFDERFAGTVIEPKKKEAKAQAKRTKSVGTTIGHTNFAAVAHNAIKQMLLALKIDETVDQVIQALQAGKRPIVALENTMGSFLDRYVKQNGLDAGDIISDFDYREVMLNMLRNTLRYQKVYSWGDVEVVYVKVDDLPLDLQDAYHATENHIKEMELDLPGSPIDEIISQLEVEGYKVGEITGRDKRLIKKGKDKYELALRSSAERDKTSIVYDYNYGDTDALIVNVAGAEGMSAHASVKFRNQEQRVMIVVQPAADINKFVQILGRINRKGQVVEPEYKILMTALPSELRPAAILENKMRSLNANTSAKTKGAYQQKEIPDILNLYGEYIVAQYITQNPDILRQMGLDIEVSKYEDAMGTGNYHGPWNEDKIARRFTGRLALLSVEQQQEFYDWAEPEFDNLIEYLTKTDQNELISTDKDYKAEEVTTKTIFVGEPGNVFQEPAALDKMSVVLEGRPMTTIEIKDEIQSVVEKANVSSPNSYMGLIRERVDFAWSEYEAGLNRKGRKVKRNTVAAYERARGMLSQIKLGSIRRDAEGNPFILLEIIDTFGKKEYAINPAAPSNIRLRIAIPHPARSVVISLAQFENSQRFYGKLDKYFNIPTDQKEERYIANGNIIAAMGVLVGDSENSKKQVRPKVINYTMADGSRRQGLLLPKTYDPSYDLPTSINMIPEAAVAYLMDNPRGVFHLKVGEARIFKAGKNSAYIEVPKSKARGLKYFGDSRLREIVGEFETWKQAMRADFSSAKLLDALVYLKGRGNSIKSDDAAPETAREYNNAHRDKPEDVGFAAEPKVPRKIALKRGVTKPAKISQRDIVNYLSKALGVSIKGVATFRKKKPGWYNKRTRGIRLRNVNNLRTATHEVGHHIDVYFNDTASKKMSHAWYGLGAELVRLGKAAYGKKRPEGGYKMEGYAEFVFGWLTGAIDLKKEAPRMLKFFEDNYLKDNADIADILHTAKDMIEQWKEQGAEARFDSQIAQKLKPLKNWKERFSLWWSTTWADVSTPIQRALQENVPSRSLEFGSKDPGFLFGFLTQTEGARARTFVIDHTIDIWGNVTGKSLKEVLRPVADEIKDFMRYVVAVRAISLHSRELESGFDNEDALYIYQKYHSLKWEKIALELTEWNHRVLGYLVQAGGLEEEAARRMRELNPVYVPFFRSFAPGEKRRTPKGVGRGLIKRGKGVYKIIGSGRPIEDPLESMITQTRRLISIAHKSMIARALAEVERKTPGLAGLIERVPPPMKATTFDAKQLKKQLIDLGIDVVPGDLDDAMLTVFGNSPIFLGKEHIISVIVDGKRQWYQVAPELYRVLEDLDQFQLPKLLNLILGKANRLCRLGATGIHAAFGLVRNPIRDILDTTVKARYARGPVAFAKGVAKDLSYTGLAKALGIDANKAAERFSDIGGQISGYLGQDRTGIQHLKGDMLTNTVAGHAIRTVRHPVDAMRALFGIPESGLRIEEFERALKDWMAKHQTQGGEPPPDAIVYAFQYASDQTINYRRAGLYGRWLNSMITFWNANAQDMSKVYRTFQERPKSAMLWGLSVLTLPAVGIWWLNKDEKWYKELPAYEKANHIHIPVFKRIKQVPLLGRFVAKYKIGKELDYVLRIPVPFLMGHIFQSMPVTVIDALYTVDPGKITDFLGEVYKADIKPLFDWPAAIGPYLDIRRNKDWADRPIVPRSVEGKMPEDQYNDYTTAFAKTLGKIFKQSPSQIEYALNSYSGGIYRRIAKSTELATGHRGKELTPKDWPLIGTLFLRDPYAPKKSIEDFYSEMELLNRMYQSDRIKPDSKMDLRRRKLNNRNRYISLFWKKLRVAKTIDERKQIYAKIGGLIKTVK